LLGIIQIGVKDREFEVFTAIKILIIVFCVMSACTDVAGYSTSR